MKERIAAIRKAFGLTQRQFGEQIGVLRQAVTNYERGRNLPTEAVRQMICRVYGVRREWLETGSGEMFEDVLDHVTDYGILVVPKPFPRGRLEKAIRFLASVQNRIHRMEKQIAATREKMEELRIVTKAKFLLVEQRHMSEEEAHRWIGKQAMDHGVSRRRIAEEIIDEDE